MTDHKLEKQMKDIQHFKNVLRKNRSTLCTALMPHFIQVLQNMPEVNAQRQSLRIRFNNNPENAIEDLLDMVAVGDNEQLWYEFFKGLDNNALQTYRRLFVPDEEWKG